MTDNQIIKIARENDVHQLKHPASESFCLQFAHALFQKSVEIPWVKFEEKKPTIGDYIMAYRPDKQTQISYHTFFYDIGDEVDYTHWVLLTPPGVE